MTELPFCVRSKKWKKKPKNNPQLWLHSYTNKLFGE